MIKLIACDLDETLLNDQKEITKKNLEAIRRAQLEYGVKFVPATGRGYTCLEDILQKLNMQDKDNEYIISNNGGIVCECKNYKHLQIHAIPFEKVKELFSYGYKRNLCVQIFTDEDVYAFHLNDEEKKWLMMFKPDSYICNEDNIEFLKTKKIIKVLFQKTDMDYLKRIAKEMEFITKDCINVSFSSNRYLELNAKGVTKGLGLRELAKYLHICMDETMAIGDNMNDYEMLQEAGISVAVSNAIQEVKDISDYITDYDCNHDAIAQAIETFVFQKERN